MVWASSCYTKYEANIHELQRLFCKTQYEVNNCPKHAHQTESTRVTEFCRLKKNACIIENQVGPHACTHICAASAYATQLHGKTQESPGISKSTERYKNYESVTVPMIWASSCYIKCAANMHELQRL